MKMTNTTIILKLFFNWDSLHAKAKQPQAMRLQEIEAQKD